MADDTSEKALSNYEVEMKAAVNRLTKAMQATRVYLVFGMKALGELDEDGRHHPQFQINHIFNPIKQHHPDLSLSDVFTIAIERMAYAGQKIEIGVIHERLALTVHPFFR